MNLATRIARLEERVKGRNLAAITAVFLDAPSEGKAMMMLAGGEFVPCPDVKAVLSRPEPLKVYIGTAMLEL